ncbi:hypothetical protein ASA1KI_02440 [Opitutales bacterium ASA1]|uniref:AGE family epimerase/isomerase n=1 Tax=Congregicoccus parvus TaxID=3081749 RepID=UPI002B2CCBC7|nr:hypothetical protein ASA1KI_02440 [Opitutales bacterium ASA1]
MTRLSLVTLAALAHALPSSAAPASDTKTSNGTLLTWAASAERELRDAVLPFWMEHVVDRERGGFHGAVSADLVVDRDAPRGSVLSTRMLWTFSMAARMYRDPGYIETARFALDDVLGRFRDPAHGGLYWTITTDGRPLDDRKQIYAQAFGIYALAEYVRATGDTAALEHAVALQRLVERHAADPVHGGYFEAFAADWSPLPAGTASVMGAPTAKSQNTHLHVMEAYTNLLRVWPDPTLRERQHALVRLMLDRILDPDTGHLRLFQDADWTPRSDAVSYGHDIEAAWLLHEAALVLDDPELLSRVRRVSVALAEVTLARGVDEDGALFYEGGPSGPTRTNKDWWPQAEAAVGFLDAYQISGDARFIEASAASWRFIEDHLVDRTHGEWFNSLTREREVRPLPKADLWKCPYHNSRACIELVTRLRAVVAAHPDAASPDRLVLNDLEYLEMRGLNVMLAHDFYPESHQGGVGFIQNGLRAATNGDLRLQSTPGQWQPVPKVGPRVVDRATGEISVRMEYPDPEKNRRGFNPIEYPDLEFAYTIRVRPEPEGAAFRIVVDLEQPLPAEWIGKVGFNIELFPGFLFGRTFAAGDTVGIFPRQPNGPGTLVEGEVRLDPLAVGRRLVVAPESEEHRLAIENLGTGDLELLDGRELHTNGWFVVRSLVPADATTSAIEWLVSPHAIPDWKSAPVVQISQVGYHPAQPKVAVIELDRHETAREVARLVRIDVSGTHETMLERVPAEWGRFLRYDYLQLDFSSVTTPGMYFVSYGDFRTEPFKIGADVYHRHVWQPTLEYFLPVQMCHMQVNDRYRVWHGCCHMGDALMAPVNHNHFDGYLQGPSTLTRFASQEKVPGLDIGGWHDAGDYDLRVESQAETIRGLALAWEEFRPEHDNTTIDQSTRVVEIHRPDGKPDILQQIEHGALTIVAGWRALGRLYRGIVEPTLRDYVLLGDPLNHLAPRWVFTEENPRRELQVAGCLAAASRALRGFNDPLAEECLAIALALWERTPHEPPAHAFSAAVELLLATDEPRFAAFLVEHRELLASSFARQGWLAARVYPRIHDTDFRAAIERAARAHRKVVDRMERKTPYGLPYEPDIWGAGWGIQRFGFEQYFLHEAFPETFPNTFMLHALNFVLGCHPGQNTTSFVSGVGSRSLLTAYGVNRADWSHIPGGSGSGTALIRPDYPELLEWPFLWQQTEYVLGGGTTDYLFLVLAADTLLNRP